MTYRKNPVVFTIRMSNADELALETLASGWKCTRADVFRRLLRKALVEDIRKGRLSARELRDALDVILDAEVDELVAA